MRTSKRNFPEPADICPSNDRQMTARDGDEDEVVFGGGVEKRDETRDEIASNSHFEN